VCGEVEGEMLLRIFVFSLRALKMSIGFEGSMPKLKLLERPLNGSSMLENRLFPFMTFSLRELKLKLEKFANFLEYQTNEQTFSIAANLN
jgi:hypothetical protein